LTRIISFSLYGNQDIYLKGALENCTLVPLHYPGWKAMFFIDEEVPKEVVDQLLNLGAHIHIGSSEISANKMTWRYSAVFLDDAEIVIFRDTDSRLSQRESAAVAEWVESENAVHIMRDHPLHSQRIMGGMWGIKAKFSVGGIQEVLDSQLNSDWGRDQDALAQFVYSRHGQNSIIHDSYFRREPHARPFPTKRYDGEFVGERFDQENKPEEKMRRIAMRYEKHGLLTKYLRLRDRCTYKP
jgi:hypothetical protein